MPSNLDQDALYYHEFPKPGKLAITATKPLATQRDLSLAYSPGVAKACEEIADDPANAQRYTSRGNLVAVISNGTAVLGLGDIGPLASKPVMEGKAVLFKKFADIDVFDIEVDEKEVDMFVETVARLEPTFGGINLEDITAPSCFEIEQKLRERMSIPVFHDDQHGTAIIVAAAVLNGLRLCDKAIEDVKLVASGAGAASLACLNLLVSMGMDRSNILVTDREGVIYKGRDSGMDKWKAPFAQETNARTLDDAIEDADIFLGLSAAGILKQDMVKKMQKSPIIMALANPTPEILPELAREVTEDAIIATGRSDYPNQVNNVLCFPFLFRGALDVNASTINEEMKIAAVKAIADLAMAEVSPLVLEAYGGEPTTFDKNNIIPKPFDPRLIVEVASAVAQAAMDSGVARKHIEDMEAYRAQLSILNFKSGNLMKPIFALAQSHHSGEKLSRVVYAEGEEYTVLQAAQKSIDENLAFPVLVGRRDIIEDRINKLGLRIKENIDFEICNINDDPRYNAYWQNYHEIMGREGISPSNAKHSVRTKNSVVAALMLHRNEADAMICGIVGPYGKHINIVENIIGRRPEVEHLSSVSALILDAGTFFFCDSHVADEPNLENIVDMTIMAAAEVRAFGIEPKVAMLSRSNFGSHNTRDAVNMRKALKLIKEREPTLMIDGEMQADSALVEKVRQKTMPSSTLEGGANLFIFPNADAANIALNLIHTLCNGVRVGPILLGAKQPVHVLPHSTSVRALVNMTALSVVQAQKYAKEN
jgi:malate dehydrogenase (oxaloacetate-decarboxylating)(NADP+)